MEFYKEKELQNFIIDYADEIEAGKAAIFGGAGLSVGTGAVSWKELLREAAHKIGLDVDQEDDLVAVAQYIYNQSNSRTNITKLIKNHININGEITDNHKTLASLPIETYWTTNYDEYIEESLRQAAKIYDSKKSVQDLSIEVQDCEATVYKMHGDINRANEAVLIKDDYEIYDKKNELFTLALKNDLISKTFLFIGFSFDDPNLETILSKVRIMLEGNTRTHYCFFKTVSENDPEFKNEKDEKVKKEKVDYAKNKQYLRIKDLERYGIKSILVDEYSEITEILEKIKKRYKSNQVFISGSNSDAHCKEYRLEGSPDEFITKLASKLHIHGFHITTGLGLYVGNHVVSGVLTGMDETKTSNIDSAIKMRAFPLINKDAEQKERWTSYRHDILEDCGNAIFIMGNKWDEKTEKLINANGVKEEFDIAHEKGINLIPIATTGYQSKMLWQKMNQNLRYYYPSANEDFENHFSMLASENISDEEMINHVLEILNINKEI
ncbi:hypothetical protein CHL76_15670 [Marinococcus halophilus]|uniref:NAD(+) hydrolase ThsA Sir2/TIR-associating SLOG domain-containing protein n=1 Tax=Marinococcus halophilus TaxID=1371 RepID=A0A510Y9S2_MARHA|nr:SIR2 family protein [Marinococcus halophilus]OZT78875.1 hypothetical protein CHL76_15670 [Marinococcus halophilus]GEK60115.1 hypothetical protein MHA01_30200 [Marinococcus halophilus]